MSTLSVNMLPCHATAQNNIVVFNLFTAIDWSSTFTTLRTTPPPPTATVVLNFFPSTNDTSLATSGTYPPSSSLQTNSTNRIFCAGLTSSTAQPFIIGQVSNYGTTNVTTDSIILQSGCSNFQTQIYMAPLTSTAIYPVQMRFKVTMFRFLCVNVRVDGLAFNTVDGVASLSSVDAAQSWRPPPIFQVMGKNGVIVNFTVTNNKFITTGLAMHFTSPPSDPAPTDLLSSLALPTGFDCSLAISSSVTLVSITIVNNTFTTAPSMCARTDNIIASNLRINSTAGIIVANNVFVGNTCPFVSVSLQPINNNTLAETTILPLGVRLRLADTPDKLSVCTQQINPPDIVGYVDPDAFTEADCPELESCDWAVASIIWGVNLLIVGLVFVAAAAFAHIAKRNKLTNKELQEDSEEPNPFADVDEEVDEKKDSDPASTETKKEQ